MNRLSRDIINEANRLSPEDPRRNLGIALGQLVETESRTKDVVLEVLESRKQFTPEHLSPLLFASLQYLALKEKDNISHFATMNSDEWKVYISRVVDKSGPVLIKLLKERNVQSFILRRYFPVKLLASVAYGKSPISILDVGSSLNLGLAAVQRDNSGEMFSGFELNEVPANLYTGKLNIMDGVGVDLFDPDKEWVKACIWPGHEDERDTIEYSSNLLRHEVSRLFFIKIDALTLDEVPELQNRFDIVVASGMIYQLQSELKVKFLETVAKIVKRKGYFLVNDYPPEVNAKDPFSYSTDVFQITNGSIQAPLNILKADSPFYKNVKLGDGFQKFINDHPRVISTF